MLNFCLQSAYIEKWGMSRSRQSSGDTERVNLTAGRIDAFKCKPGKSQSFMWDTNTPGLAVRATTPGGRNPTGSKAYIFQSRLGNKVFRITIGSVKSWAIEEVRDANGDVIIPGARQEARRLQALVDQGIDPRQYKAERLADAEAKRHSVEAARVAENEAVRRGQISVDEVWIRYIEARRDKWSKRHLFDHQKLMRPERNSGDGPTIRKLTPGVLASLAPLPLSSLTPETITQWLDAETPKRGTQAALAFRLLRAFLNWCEDTEAYRGIASPDACAKKISRDHVPKVRAKADALQREQLCIWFESVRKIPNLTISAYLQGLLITGARRNELTGLRWADVDFQWNSVTIHDKVEENRTIPLTPYFSSLLYDLKIRNETPPSIRRLNTLKARGEDWMPSEWVFSSQTSKTGQLQEPSIAHRTALSAVGLPPISLHGLRRSFGSLAEWCECPVGVVAQIQGHKPSATAEKHYRVRPLDLLRMWHIKIETWMLEQAKIPFTYSNSDNETA